MEPQSLHSSPIITDADESYLQLRLPLPIGYLLHNRYRISGILSENGGFGMTYRAVDTYRDLNLDVVVKENFPLGVAVRNPSTHELSPARGLEKSYNKALQRFEEEAELLSILNHPNIVRVNAHFKELKTAYYVMPHIGGNEVHNAMSPPDTLSEAELKPVLCCLLNTLHFMHGYNLMHRDIKPSNILMDANGTPVLIDFGLVRSAKNNRTLTCHYTPGYAPVEQISGKGKSGPWIDLYSLGATCYALITGSAPPDALDRLEDDEYIPLQSRHELHNRYSSAILAGIDRALKMRRADRWQSAQEWLDALNATTTPETLQQNKQPTIPQQTIPRHLSQDEARRLLQEQNIAPAAYDDKLIEYAEEGKSELVRLLIAAGADVNKGNDDGSTPLCQAAANNRTECVKLLLAAPGIDVNKANKHGWTPLFVASWHNRVGCVKLLLSAPGIDVNKADKRGQTPLHNAAWFGHTECVNLLKAAGGKHGDHGGLLDIFFS